MANVFLNLPIVINGTGAAVDVSSMGRVKTLTLEGVFTGTLIVEASNNGGTSFFPLLVLSRQGDYELQVAAQFLRVRSRGAKALAPFSPAIDVGSNDNGGSYGVVPAPAKNAVGAMLNVSSFGTFTTIVITGSISGVIALEATEDGTEWVEVATFQAAGVKSFDLVANQVRARSRGAKDNEPFSPLISIGSINDPVTSGGAAAASPNCLIYQPGGGGSGPVVFDTWADLMTELAALKANSNSDGCYTILFDDSVTSPAVIPSGTYDMKGVRWRGRTPSPTAPGLQAVVSVADGAVFENLREIEHNLRIEFAGATVPIADMDGGHVLTIRDNVTIVVTGATALIDFSNSLTVDTTAEIIMDEQVFLGDGSNTVIRGFYAIPPEPGSGTVILSLGSEVDISTEALVFGNGLNANILYRNGSARVEPQTTLSATFSTTTQERWETADVSGNTIVNTTDEDFGKLYRCDPDTGDITINLPASIPENRGRPFTVKRIDTAAANNVNVTPAGTDQIDSGGAGTPFVNSTSLSSNTFISDGAGGWDVI